MSPLPETIAGISTARNRAGKLVIDEVTPPQAWKILNSEEPSVLLDVRSKVEFDYVGHPSGAINVPWQEAPDWEVDPEFVEKVRARLQSAGKGNPEEQTILTLCRSGKRSMDAGIRLAQSGFKKVINIAEGFEGDLDEKKHRGNINGWQFYKLPWEQT